MIYPAMLKIGVKRPIYYKTGKRDDYNNYRPITILSCIDKIIEGYMSNQLNKYVTRNEVIHTKQYIFQINKNTTQLLRTFSDQVND